LTEYFCCDRLKKTNKKQIKNKSRDGKSSMAGTSREGSILVEAVYEEAL